MGTEDGHPNGRFYDRTFYATQQEGALRSAGLLLPPVFALLAPKSVVDVGCGVGAWMKTAVDLGVEDYVGIDGAHVDPSILLFDKSHFQPQDLVGGVTLDRKFDLAMCLEVAEHLPDAAAATLVRGLCGLAPAVLFSGAFPGQGGTRHINERWPSYWRRHFATNGYVQVDCVRPRALLEPGIEYWYRTNTFVYAREDYVQRMPALQPYVTRAGEELVLLPQRYVDTRTMGVRTWMGLFGRLAASLPNMLRRLGSTAS